MCKNIFKLLNVICIGICILTSFLFFSSVEAKRDKRPYQYNLSVMAMFQDEGDYLKEWIEYHLMLGVQHFYLYNHNSKDHFLKVLAPYIANGIVDYIDYSQPGYPQNEAIKDVLGKAKYKTKWLAVIDIDEFFLPKKNTTLTEFLSNYESYAGVTVNWQCFGTSQVPFILPGELMLEHLTFRADSHFGWNSHVKCIVRPERVKDVVNTHCFTYKSPYFAVRPNKTKQEHSHDSPIQTDLIVLNHYWTKDEHFLMNVKVPRCETMKKWSKEQTIASANEMNAVEDRLLVEKFIKQLKNRMGKNP